MIRRAVRSDIEGIEKSYQMHFNHEKEHHAYTMFREGVYPTGKVAEDAVDDGSMYVCEDENGNILGSIIFDRKQPEEYGRIDWPCKADDEQTGVIHLLLVRPDAAGRGVGTSLLSYVTEIAEKLGCRVLRLDTGAQNTPAASLYQKLGFRLVSASSMKIGGVILHDKHLFFEK